jgi:hypothetical protein
VATLPNAQIEPPAPRYRQPDPESRVTYASHGEHAGIPRHNETGRAHLDYVKSVADLEVSNVTQASVGSLAAYEATVVAGPETPVCPEIWLWGTDTEASPERDPAWRDGANGRR